MGGNNDFFENFEINKYLKKLPSMQRVNRSNNDITKTIAIRKQSPLFGYHHCQNMYTFKPVLGIYVRFKLVVI